VTDIPVPRRAKIELLVRRDDESFELQEVSSSAAWVQMCPTRVADADFELAEVTSRVSQKAPSRVSQRARSLFTAGLLIQEDGAGDPIP